MTSLGLYDNNMEFNPTDQVPVKKEEKNDVTNRIAVV